MEESCLIPQFHFLLLKCFTIKYQITVVEELLKVKYWIPALWKNHNDQLLKLLYKGLVV